MNFAVVPLLASVALPTKVELHLQVHQFHLGGRDEQEVHQIPQPDETLEWEVVEGGLEGARQNTSRRKRARLVWLERRRKQLCLHSLRL